MRTLAIVLSALAIVGLYGCAGVYVAADGGGASSSLDTHPTSR